MSLQMLGDERFHGSGCVSKAAKGCTCGMDQNLAMVEHESADQRIRAARSIAGYWRDSYMEMVVAGESRWGIGTHPLALVLSALDGETDPAELGIPERLHDDFRAALHSKKAPGVA